MPSMQSGPPVNPPRITSELIEQLAWKYTIQYKPIEATYKDMLPHTGLFSTHELHLFHWLDQNPEAAKLLTDHAHQQLEAQRREEQQVHLWDDGSISTKADHERALAAKHFTEGVSIVTSNILGAIGMGLAMNSYPNDPAMQNKAAKLFSQFGELIVLHGEAVHTGHQYKEYTPGHPDMALYGKSHAKPSLAPVGHDVVGHQSHRPHTGDHHAHAGGHRELEHRLVGDMAMESAVDVLLVSRSIGGRGGHRSTDQHAGLIVDFGAGKGSFVVEGGPTSDGRLVGRVEPGGVEQFAKARGADWDYPEDTVQLEVHVLVRIEDAQLLSNNLQDAIELQRAVESVNAQFVGENYSYDQGPNSNSYVHLVLHELELPIQLRADGPPLKGWDWDHPMSSPDPFWGDARADAESGSDSGVGASVFPSAAPYSDPFGPGGLAEPMCSDPFSSDTTSGSESNALYSDPFGSGGLQGSLAEPVCSPDPFCYNPGISASPADAPYSWEASDSQK